MSESGYYQKLFKDLFEGHPATLIANLEELKRFSANLTAANNKTIERRHLDEDSITQADIGQEKRNGIELGCEPRRCRSPEYAALLELVNNWVDNAERLKRGEINHVIKSPRRILQSILGL